MSFLWYLGLSDCLYWRLILLHKNASRYVAADDGVAAVASKCWKMDKVSPYCMLAL